MKLLFEIPFTRHVVSIGKKVVFTACKSSDFFNMHKGNMSEYLGVVSNSIPTIVLDNHIRELCTFSEGIIFSQSSGPEIVKYYNFSSIKG